MRRLLHWLRRSSPSASPAIEHEPVPEDTPLLFQVIAEKRRLRETEGRRLFQELERRRAEASPTADVVGGGEAAAIAAAATESAPASGEKRARFRISLRAPSLRLSLPFRMPTPRFGIVPSLRLPRLRVTKGRLSIAGALAVALAIATVGIAYWTTGGSGSAGASVGTLEAPGNATASNTPGSGTVHITWDGVVAPDGGAVDGYYVRRFLGSTPSAACGTSPSNLTSSLSCNDLSVADGTYTWKVTAVFRSWTAESGASNSITVVNDTTAPTVSSINRANPSPTNGSSVQWTVTFSENVSGVDTSDFVLAGTGTSGASITNVSGGSNSYTVTASTGADGTLGLNVVDDDSIVDGVGNKLGGTGVANGNFTGQLYTVDKAAPTLSSINRAGTNPANTGPLTWTVTFSEPVNGVITSNFALATSNIGGTAPSITSATPTGGAPAAAWTVSVSTTGATGQNTGSIGLNLANTTNIKDVATNNLSAATPVVGQAYTYDTTAPTLISINRAERTRPTSARSLGR